MFISKNALNEEYNSILEKAGNPPVMLLTRKTFEKVNNIKIPKRSAGFSNTHKWVMWVNKNQRDMDDLHDTIWHELLHCVFPCCPETWIKLCTAKLSGVPTDVKDDYETPSKEELLKLMRDASKVMRGEMS